jgi:hypothetical protein
MTGYTFEVWADHTMSGADGRAVYVARVADPFGLVIGEVRSLSEDTTLRLANELKKGDKGRYAADHGLCA